MRQAEVEAAEAFLDLARGNSQAGRAEDDGDPSKSAPKNASANMAPSVIRSGNAQVRSPPSASQRALSAQSAPPVPQSHGKPVPSVWAAAYNHKPTLRKSDNTSDASKRKRSGLESVRSNNDAAASQPKIKKVKKKAEEDQDAPKRPYHSYSIFFAVEREKILTVVPEDGVQAEDKDARIQAVVSCLETALSPEEEGSLEKRVASRILQEQCQTIGQGKKKPRKHRKSHGKLGFVEMNAVISRRWKVLPEAKKDWYRDLGTMDSMRFTQAMDAYKRMKKTSKLKMGVGKGESK